TIRMSPRSRASTPGRGPPTSTSSWRSPGWPSTDPGMHLDAVQVVADLDLPVEHRRGQRPPVLLLAGLQRRHVVGEDQYSDAGACRGVGGLLDRRVVVADVTDALHGHR